jgi:hypothetical protein
MFGWGIREVAISRWRDGRIILVESESEVKRLRLLSSAVTKLAHDTDQTVQSVCSESTRLRRCGGATEQYQAEPYLPCLPSRTYLCHHVVRASDRPWPRRKPLQRSTLSSGSP